MQERYDVRVLFGVGRPVGYRSALLRNQWPPRKGRARLLPGGEDVVPSPPPAIGFEYVYRPVDEAATWKATIHGYQQAMHRLVAKGWKPDLLHAHSAEVAGIVAAALARELQIPWVLTEHQAFVLARYSEHRRRLMVEAIQAATKVVAVSHHQMRCIVMHGIDRLMAVVGNLIDEQQFPLAESQRDPARFRILTVTYPSPFKDCETFFKAVALVVERGHADVEVTVIGNNSFHDLASANTNDFASLARRYRVQQVCRFIAYASREDMPRHYAACDVFVSSSVAETFGVAVREAMCVGRPAVCTASGGVEDDLSPINGVKVNIRDAEALADALIAIKTGRLVFDPKQVRCSIVVQHGRQAFLDRMSAVYDEAIASHVIEAGTA